MANSKAAQAGRVQAEADIVAGKLQYIYCGQGSTFSDAVIRYHQLLKARLGLDAWVYFECPYQGQRSRREFAAEYNRRVKEEIDRRFGPTAMDLWHLV
jgi:hypothetical protein